jgi:hypothetical protein
VATSGSLLLRRNEVAAAGLLAGFVLLLVGIALLASGGTSGGAATGDVEALPPDDTVTTADAGATTADDTVTTADAGATTADADATTDAGVTTADAGATSGDTRTFGSDEEAIQWLARRSIEVLPAGQWPSLYDSFTSEFQQRCPRAQYDQVGVDAAAEQGDNLRLLRFNRLESVTIDGSTAQAVIVGEVVGQSEYQIQAAFQKENGDWKIAPAPNTQGCDPFVRLTG